MNGTNQNSFSFCCFRLIRCFVLTLEAEIRRLIPRRNEEAVFIFIVNFAGQAHCLSNVVNMYVVFY